MKQGFVKVAAATPNVKVADVDYNKQEICRVIDETVANGAKIVAFPELCITGYTCGDLFTQDILLKKAGRLPKPIDFASVLTLPATASEMNNGAVISRRDRAEKLAFHNPQGYPIFSILDPNVVLSLPKKQISNGIADIYAHTLEQYLTTCLDTKVMDRWAESLLLTLIEEAEELMSENPSYNSCANFMLTATMGLNGFIAMGDAAFLTKPTCGEGCTSSHDRTRTHCIVWIRSWRNSCDRSPRTYGRDERREKRQVVAIC